MPYVPASYPIAGVMMPTGQKPNGPHWMTATTQILDARTASMTSTTETGAAIPTTPWTGEPHRGPMTMLGGLCAHRPLPIWSH